MSRIPTVLDETSRPLNVLANYSDIPPCGVILLQRPSELLKEGEDLYYIAGYYSTYTGNGGFPAACGVEGIKKGTRSVAYANWPRYVAVNTQTGKLKDFRSQYWYYRDYRLHAFKNSDEFTMRVFSPTFAMFKALFVMDSLSEKYGDKKNGFAWMRPVEFNGLPLIRYGTVLDEFTFADNLSVEDDLVVAFPFKTKYAAVYDAQFVYSGATITNAESVLVRPDKDDPLKLQIVWGGQMMGVFQGVVEMSCEAEISIKLQVTDISKNVSNVILSTLVENDSLSQTAQSCSYNGDDVHRYEFKIPFTTNVFPKEMTDAEKAKQDAMADPLEPIYSIQILFDGFEGNASTKVLKVTNLQFDIASVPGNLFGMYGDLGLGFGYLDWMNNTGFRDTGTV